MRLGVSILVILALLFMLAIGAVKVFDLDVKWLQDFMTETSDAGGDLTKSRGALDGYLGYYILRSPMFRMNARRPPSALNVVWNDDRANYPERIAKFTKGDYDWIVMPVAEWLVEGKKNDYRTGVMTTVLTESDGADGMAGFSDVVTGNLSKDLANSNLRFVYIPGTPSETLLNAASATLQFDIPEHNRILVGSEDELMENARKREGDIFITWEPFLTRLKKQYGMVDVWSSAQFKGYIKDVLIWNRSEVEKHPERVERFLGVYYTTLMAYQNQPERLLDDMEKDYPDLTREELKGILKKVKFLDVFENATQEFGLEHGGRLGNDGLHVTIEDCITIQMRFGKLAAYPIDDPDKLFNSSFIRKLSEGRSQVFASAREVRIQWTKLSDSEWDALPEVAQLRLRDINFKMGTPELTQEGLQIVDQFGQQLTQNFPTHRVKLVGHTLPDGNPKVLDPLSLARAEAVTRRLITVHEIDPNRMKAYGRGGREQPSYKLPGNQREQLKRRARVEIRLVAGNQL